MDRHWSSPAARQAASAARSPASRPPSSCHRTLSPGKKFPQSPVSQTAGLGSPKATVFPQPTLYANGGITPVSCERPNRRRTAGSRESISGAGQPRSSRTSPAYSELHFPLSSPHASFYPQEEASSASSLVPPTWSSLSDTAAESNTHVAIASASQADHSSQPYTIVQAPAPSHPPGGTTQITVEKRPRRLYPTLTPPSSPPAAHKLRTSQTISAHIRSQDTLKTASSSGPSAAHNPGMASNWRECAAPQTDAVLQQRDGKAMGAVEAVCGSAVCQWNRALDADDGKHEFSAGNKHHGEHGKIPAPGSQQIPVLPAILTVFQNASSRSHASDRGAWSQKQGAHVFLPSSPLFCVSGVPTPLRGDGGEDRSASPVALPAASPSPFSVLKDSLRRLSPTSAASLTPASLQRPQASLAEYQSASAESSSSQNPPQSSVSRADELTPQRNGAGLDKEEGFSPSRILAAASSAESSSLAALPREAAAAERRTNDAASTPTGASSARRPEADEESLFSVPRGVTTPLRSAAGSSFSSCSSPLLRSPVSLPQAPSESSGSPSSSRMRPSSFSSLPPPLNSSASLGAQEAESLAAFSQEDSARLAPSLGGNEELRPLSQLAPPASAGGLERRSEPPSEDAPSRDASPVRQGGGGAEGGQGEGEKTRDEAASCSSPHYCQPGSLSAAFCQLQEKQETARSVLSPFSSASDGNSSASLLLTQPLSSPLSGADTPGGAAEAAEATQSKERGGEPARGGAAASNLAEERREKEADWEDEQSRARRNGADTNGGIEDAGGQVVVGVNEVSEMTYLHVQLASSAQAADGSSQVSVESRGELWYAQETTAFSPRVEGGDKGHKAEEETRSHAAHAEGLEGGDATREGEQAAEIERRPEDASLADLSQHLDAGRVREAPATGQLEADLREGENDAAGGVREGRELFDDSLDETTALNTQRNRSPFTRRRRHLFLRQAGSASGVWTLHAPTASLDEATHIGGRSGAELDEEEMDMVQHAERTQEGSRGVRAEGDESEEKQSAVTPSPQAAVFVSRGAQTHDSEVDAEGRLAELELRRRASAPADRRRDSSLEINLASPCSSLPLPPRKRPTPALPASPSPLCAREDDETVERKKRRTAPFSPLVALAPSSPCRANLDSQDKEANRERPMSPEVFLTPPSRRSAQQKQALSSFASPLNFSASASAVAGGDEEAASKKTGETEIGAAAKQQDGTPCSAKKKVEFGSASVAVFEDSPNSYRSPMLPDRAMPLSDHERIEKKHAGLSSPPSKAAASGAFSSSSCPLSAPPPRPSPLEELKEAERCLRPARSASVPSPLPSPSSVRSALAASASASSLSSSFTSCMSASLGCASPSSAAVLRSAPLGAAAAAAREKAVQQIQGGRQAGEGEGGEVDNVAAKAGEFAGEEASSPMTRKKATLEKGVQTPEKIQKSLELEGARSAEGMSPSASCQRLPVIVVPAAAEPDRVQTSFSSVSSFLSSLSAPLQVISVSSELLTVTDKPQQPDSGPSALFRPCPPVSLPTSPSLLLAENSPFSLKAVSASSPFRSSSLPPTTSPACPSSSSALSPRSPARVSASRPLLSSSPLRAAPPPAPAGSPLPSSASAALPADTSSPRASPLASEASPSSVAVVEIGTQPSPRADTAGGGGAESSPRSSVSSAPLSPFEAFDPLNGDEPLSPRVLVFSGEGGQRLATLSGFGAYLSSVQSRLLLCGGEKREEAKEHDSQEQPPRGESGDAAEAETDVLTESAKQPAGQGKDSIDAGREAEEDAKEGEEVDGPLAKAADDEAGLEKDGAGAEEEEKDAPEEEAAAEKPAEEGSEKAEDARVEETEIWDTALSDILENAAEAATLAGLQPSASDSEAEARPAAPEETEVSREEDEGENELQPVEAQASLSPTQRQNPSRLSLSAASPPPPPDREADTRCSTEETRAEGQQLPAERVQPEDEAPKDKLVGAAESETEERRDASEAAAAESSGQDVSPARGVRALSAEAPKDAQAETPRAASPIAESRQSRAAAAETAAQSPLLTFSQLVEKTQVGQGLLAWRGQEAAHATLSSSCASEDWSVCIRRLASSLAREAFSRQNAKKTEEAWRACCAEALEQLHHTEAKIFAEASRLCEASHAFLDSAAPRPPREEDVRRLATEPWGSEISLAVEDKERKLQEKAQRREANEEELRALQRQIEHAEAETDAKALELSHFSSSNQDLQLLAEIRRKQGIVLAFEQMSCMRIVHFNPRGLLASLAWPRSAPPSLSSSRRVYLAAEKAAKYPFPLSSSVLNLARLGSETRVDDADAEGPQAARRPDRERRQASSLSCLPANFPLPLLPEGLVARSRACLPLFASPSSRLPSASCSSSSLSASSSSLSWPPPTKICILWRAPAAAGKEAGAGARAPPPPLAAAGEAPARPNDGALQRAAPSGILRVQKLGVASWKKLREAGRGDEGAADAPKAGEARDDAVGPFAALAARSPAALPSPPSRHKQERESLQGERAEGEESKAAELYEARLVTCFPYLAAHEEEKNAIKKRGATEDDRDAKRRRGPRGGKLLGSAGSVFSEKKVARKTEDTPRGVPIQDRWKVEMDRFRRNTLRIAQIGLTEVLHALQPSLSAALDSMRGGSDLASFVACEGQRSALARDFEEKENFDSGGRRESVSSSLAASASRRTSVGTVGSSSSVDLSASSFASLAATANLPLAVQQGKHSLPAGCGGLSASAPSSLAKQKQSSPRFFPDMWSVRTLLLHAHTAVGRLALLHDQLLLFLRRFRTLTELSYSFESRGSDSSASAATEDQAKSQQTRDNENVALVTVRTALTPLHVELPSLRLSIEIDLNEAIHQGSLLLGVRDVRVDPIDEEDRAFPDTGRAAGALLQRLQDSLNSLWTVDGTLSSEGAAAAFKDEIFLQWILHAAIECGYDRTLWLDGGLSALSQGVGLSGSSVCSLFEKLGALEALQREKRRTCSLAVEGHESAKNQKKGFRAERV
ncbi:hypothetical protein BESB_028070 [Besnoitia besnoiti]|uniref:Uncharacterized protein n=1 Tax=Besnoitia besnoiti TaxID=94643 RepID=A0A2A9M7N7_BESBE|nr:uncharacterized protein BESB_028070 [Besnoitia besnoiti]PFH31372.1 hypothetical protein BESB_028070 [Besnoitia besnoiti]